MKQKTSCVFLCRQYSGAIGFLKGGAAIFQYLQYFELISIFKLQYFLLFFEKGVQNCRDSKIVLTTCHPPGTQVSAATESSISQPQLTNNNDGFDLCPAQLPSHVDQKCVCYSTDSLTPECVSSEFLSFQLFPPFSPKVERSVENWKWKKNHGDK